MKRSQTIAALATACLVAGTGGAWAQTGITAIPTGSNTLLYETFRQWCDAPPDFDALSERAHKYKPLADAKTNSPDGGTVETRQWRYNKSSGDYAIGAVRISHGARTESVCNVFFPDLTDASMPDFLSETRRLGAPKQQSPAKDVTLWNGPFPNTAIQLELRNAGQRYQGVLSLLQTEPGQ